MSKQVVHTPDAPKAIGPYSQAIRAGALVFCSGQIGIDPKSGHLVKGGIAAETKQALENLCHVIGAAGGRLDQVVKTTVYLRDLAAFGEMNRVYAEHFPQQPPARATIGVSALPAGAEVEIEAIVHLDASPDGARGER